MRDGIGQACSDRIGVGCLNLVGVFLAFEVHKLAIVFQEDLFNLDASSCDLQRNISGSPLCGDNDDIDLVDHFWRLDFLSSSRDVGSNFAGI